MSKDYVVYAMEDFEFMGVKKVFKSKEDADSYVISQRHQYHTDNISMYVDEKQVN